MTTASLAFLFLLSASMTHAQDVEPLLLEEPGTITETGCGVERWDVKTLSDADTAWITFTKPIAATITQLAQLPRFTPGDTTSRQAAERAIYRVQALLYAYKLEDDGDIHMLLRDPTTDSIMITEIPDPDCPEVAGTSRSALFTDARQWLLDSVGKPTTAFTYLATPKLVSVTGVAFYDQPHNQTGRAANNLELHPVLSVSGATVSGVDDGKQTTTVEMDLSEER